VFHKIGTPVHFSNIILPCGPISIIDIPNCSAENWLEVCDTCTYLTFRYSLKILTSLSNFWKFIETPDFIPPNLWPPNSPDINPVDYKIWGLLQEQIYKTNIKDIDQLQHRIAEEWDKQPDQRIIDEAVMLQSGERDFEHVWLQVEDSLSTKCEHLSFVIFCKGIFWPNSLKYCCFVQ